MFLELECSVCHQLEFFDTDETADDVNKSICDTCALAVHESIAGQDLQAIPRPTAQQPHSFDLASSASSTPAKDSKCKGKRVDSTHSDANIGEIIVLEDTVGEPHRVNILTDALSHARSLLQSGLADSEEMDVARATLLSLGCETVDSILGLSPNNPDCQGGGVGPSARFTGFKGSLFGPRKDYVSRPSSSSSSMTRSLPNYSTLHQSSLKRRRIADFNDDAALKETSPSPTKVRPVREPLLNQESKQNSFARVCPRCKAKGTGRFQSTDTRDFPGAAI
ncbi:hypothetical protein BC830DRAFT_934657 [Chytriomyces sp. MP71]|nr:hypothetical protein BC830DRAFT_934657 [Chytriomyces sp. MP71]